MIIKSNDCHCIEYNMTNQVANQQHQQKCLKNWSTTNYENMHTLKIKAQWSASDLVPGRGRMGWIWMSDKCTPKPPDGDRVTAWGFISAIRELILLAFNSVALDLLSISREHQCQSCN